ncbi:MAG: hypothetical protein UT05_C0010G0037 [Parcubacteria group bacterium GW2011_GWF2_38_76]|nr:MAG: hypothetical protein UT05_C0010G0037 [Parcubacteria group bacterium GW2011_GWF2_38_76]
MYVCGICKSEAEYPGECCNEKMDCNICMGADGEDRCQLCKDYDGFIE